MTVKYYALLTNLGAAKLANAAALGTKLQITQMAVGDGGGTLPTPNASQTALIGEKRRAPLNQLSIDAANSSQIIAEQIIPESDGGFWIREIGLYDADGTLIAVANCAETYKPQLQEGSGRTQTVRLILIVNSMDAVTLKIDPSVVLATRKYVDDAVIEVKAYADKALAAHIAAANPHTQYLLSAKGSALPIGAPTPWPLAVAPEGWLKCNGAAFSAAAYPALAKAYPALVLPDLRGEFIRGWDDGRGVDAGRELLSFQSDAIRNIIGTVNPVYTGSGSRATGALTTTVNAGTVAIPAQAGGTQSANTIGFDASKSVPTASDNRPRNVAFNYIVRAA